MDGNIELLSHIYQSAEMGRDSSEKLMDIAQDPALLKKIHSQHQEYSRIHQSARDLLHSRGGEEKGVSPVKKVSADLGVRLQTLTDSSPSHIADMMIQGSTMGVTNSLKHLREYPTADREVVSLARKLLDTEQQNIEEMKQFL